MTLNAANAPWYKQRWPWILMAGPALVVVAGIITTWLAVISNDGLVTDDYYKQGLAVNQRLHRDQQAARLGLHADVMRSGLNLRLLLVGEMPSPLPAAITLKLTHPTRKGFDQEVQMNPVGGQGQGFYGGKLAEQIGGRWLVSLEDPAGEWRLQGEWLADSEEPLRLMAKVEK